MKYFTLEGQSFEAFHRTAGIKARDDLYSVFEKEGLTPLKIPFNNDKRINASSLDKIMWYLKIKKVWDKSLENIGAGDEIIIQLPLVEHSPLATGAFKKCKKRGAKITIFIHDLELIRCSNDKRESLPSRIRLKIEEESMLKLASYIVVHNAAMKEKVLNMGIDSKKIVVLEIFDYLIDEKFELCEPIINQGNSQENPENAKDKMGKFTCDLCKPIVIAGNLMKSKSGYVYDLPKTPKFNLYGRNYTNDKKTDNITYRGSFESDEIPNVIGKEGAFGLVWDGESKDTCSGIYGEYLRVNNPHKTSLYIASGLPIIIWKEAALAEYVQRERIGFVVDSLDEIDKKLSNISYEEYESMRKNVAVLANKLREGYYTKKALAKCLSDN